MKSVVMIAYWFPPEGNAATYRPLRFVRHLPAMGWRGSVVAADTKVYERYDPGLLALVPSHTEVVRVRSRDPWRALQERRVQRIQQKTEQCRMLLASPNGRSKNNLIRAWARAVVRTAELWCYHPDAAMGWIEPAAKATIALCARIQPEVIWATGMPWSSFVVASRASQRTGVPYVLDFRSSWTLVPSEEEARRPAWAQRRDRQNLSELFKRAQAVIFAYPTEAECYWRAYPGALEVSKIHVIPNGFEGTIEQFAAPAGSQCRVLYTGTLSSYRYDTLLQALNHLKQSDPIRSMLLRLCFVGEECNELTDKAVALGLAGMVEARGPVSYAEVQGLQREAHALLMLERVPTHKGYELLAGAKLFGYLRAGRPIVGVLPSGEAQRILQRAGVSTIANADSPSQIAVVFQKLIDAWSKGTLSSLVPNRAACEAYSAERQTAALVRALEGLPAIEVYIPGSVEIPPSLQKEIGDNGWINRLSPAERDRNAFLYS